MDTPEDFDPEKADPQSYLRLSENTYCKRPLRTLGQGSFGKVLECYHYVEEEGRWVLAAVKIFSGSALHKHKIQKEIRITLEAASPHVVRVLGSGTWVLKTEAGVQSEFPYLVLEKMECNLRKLMLEKRGGPFPHTDAVLLFKAMLEAVEFLHQQRIFHRDIKPENFLLDSQNRLKLSDFGEATLETQCNSIVGSPAYLPPEIFEVESGSATSYEAPLADIFSLGTTLYHISYDPYYLKVSDKGSKTPKLPIRDEESADYRELIHGMTRFVGRLTIEQIKRNKWYLQTLEQVLAKTASLALENTLKHHDPVIEIVLRTLQIMYLRQFFTFSEAAIQLVFMRLTRYYCSEVDSLAKHSQLVANVLKYSKAIALSKLMMMKVWTTAAQTEYEVQLDPLSFVLMLKPDTQITLSAFLQKAKSDCTLAFKTETITKMKEKYHQNLAELAKITSKHPEYNACIQFIEITEGYVEVADLPAFEVQVEIKKEKLSKKLADLCRFQEPLDFHAKARIDAYVSRIQYAVLTCAGIANLSSAEIKNLMNSGTEQADPEIQAVFNILQQDL